MTSYLSCTELLDNAFNRAPKLVPRGPMDAVFLGNANPVPRVLWHYTSMEGLIGILNEHCLRASAITCLNDESEVRAGINFLRPLLSEACASAQCSDRVRNLLTELGGQLASMNEIHQRKEPRLFVSCFSEAHNQLSQWRGYGAGATGVAIGFAAEGLQSLEAADHAGVVLTRALYLDNLEARARDLFARLAAPLDGLLAQCEIAEHEHDGSTADAFKRLTTAIKSLAANAVIRIVAAMKHPAFVEEKEWRLCMAVYPPPSCLKARSTPGGLVPYLELRSSDSRESSSKRLPLEGVIVGPSPRQDSNAGAIVALLRSSGYAKVDVAKSDVPFRL
jgi:hypothetical protein